MRIRAHTYTRTHTYTDTHTYTYIHTRTLTLTLTHTYTSTPPQVQFGLRQKPQNPSQQVREEMGGMGKGAGLGGSLEHLA